MGRIIKWIKDTRSSLAKGVGLFNGNTDRALIQNLPLQPNWYFSAELGQPRGLDVLELRKYAKSAWVQMATNAIIKRVITTKWQIVKKDEEDETDYSKDIELITKRLTYCNRNGDTFKDIWAPFLRDILELDAGVVLKCRNYAGEVVELFPSDGSRFLINIDPYGIINEEKGYYQYSFRFPQSSPKQFPRDDVVYGKMNTNTELYPYGFSPLQSVQQEVEVLIQSTRYNKEFFKNNSVPDGIISVPMDSEQLNQFRDMWEKEIKGRAHKLIFHNTDAKFTSMSLSNKDMEWLEGQKWYFHLVFAAYGLSPQEVGFYENSNRSTGEVQSQVSIKNAILPYYELIENKITNNLIPEYVSHDKLKFKWVIEDGEMLQTMHQQIMDKLTNGVLTINEVRNMEGYDNVDWGDKPISMQQSHAGFNNIQPYENRKGEEKNEENNEDFKESKEESTKSFKKTQSDIEEDAVDYNEFLVKNFNKWEKSVLSSIDEHIKDEINKDYIEKTFGQFINRVFNVVNTSNFIGGLKKVISKSLKIGINEAEKELNMDIGIGTDFDKVVTYYANRQLDGFYIDGKRWAGLKGVTKELQEEISVTVADGINKKQSVVEIKDSIKELFNKYAGGIIDGNETDGRSMRIARTETNRFINSGKHEAFKTSGLKGKKKWVAYIDDKTTDICRELHGKTVPLDSVFETKSGKQFSYPPHGCNCRSVIEFVPE